MLVRPPSDRGADQALARRVGKRELKQAAQFPAIRALAPTLSVAGAVPSQ